MAPTFRNEDEEAQHCLSTLRDGTGAEKIVARERLAAIFSRRGLFEEAAELYELNIRAGVRSPEVFEDLSAVYRQLGDQGSAEAALTEARRLRANLDDKAPARPATDEARVMPLPDAAQTPPPERTPSVATPGPGTGQQTAGGRRASPAARSPSREAPDPGSDRSPNGEAAPTQDGAGYLPSLQIAPDRAPVPRTDLDDEVPRPARSVPGPLLVVGVVLFMIVLPVVLLAMLVVNPLGLYLEGRAAGPTLDVSASEPPKLKVAPGASATWYLRTGHSVSGLWATPGLELTTAEPIDGVGGSASVTAPRSPSWGETITIVERRGQGRANQETIVPATFEAPATLPPAGTVLDGKIAGQVTAPRLTDTGQFNTTSESVNLPVQLVVVSRLDLWLDRFWNSLDMFFDEDRWLLVTIGAILTWCVLAGGAALLFRVRRS